MEQAYGTVSTLQAARESCFFISTDKGEKIFTP